MHSKRSPRCLAHATPARTTDALVAAARRWCLERDLLVILTIPRSVALRLGRGGVERPTPLWSRAVDVTVETLTGPPAGPDPALLDRFTRCQLFVWTNRWGPSGGVDVVWAPSRAGFEPPIV